MELEWHWFNVEISPEISGFLLVFFVELDYPSPLVVASGKMFPSPRGTGQKQLRSPYFFHSRTEVVV